MIIDKGMKKSKSSQYGPSDLFPEDKMGFTTPAAPGHSLKLLNNYMRTDLLRFVHEQIQKRIDEKVTGSPLKHIADSLTEVIATYEGINLFESVGPNPFHIDRGCTFDREKDYLHDIYLMKYHLKAHKRTLRELSDSW